jgi:hypothetical protein
MRFRNLDLLENEIEITLDVSHHKTPPMQVHEPRKTKAHIRRVGRVLAIRTDGAQRLAEVGAYKGVETAEGLISSDHRRRRVSDVGSQLRASSLQFSERVPGERTSSLKSTETTAR